MSLKSLNYNHLYYFYIIGREGSLAKAAKLLNVTQPTLSQQLAQLEKQLGQSLFRRKGRSLEMNAQGKFVYARAEQMFEISEEIMLGLTYQEASADLDFIKIGVAPMVSKLFSSTLLDPLLDKGECIVVKNGDFDHLLDLLYRFEVNFILSETLPKAWKSHGLTTVEVQSYKYSFVCATDVYRPDLTVEDLSQLPYFKYPIDTHLQKQIEHYFLENNIHPRICGEADDLNIVIKGTERASCFSVLPDVVIQRQLQRKSLMRLRGLESYESKIFAIFLDDFSNDKVKKIISKISLTTSA